jgi:hypothetical protein
MGLFNFFVVQGRAACSVAFSCGINVNAKLELGPTNTLASKKNGHIWSFDATILITYTKLRKYYRTKL